MKYKIFNLCPMNSQSSSLAEKSEQLHTPQNYEIFKAVLLASIVL